MSIGDLRKPRSDAPADFASDGSPDVQAPADPNTPSAPKSETGRVQFDDRGNAIWEWSVATGAFGHEVSTERLRRLENPSLSLAEDAPTPFDKVKPNPMGTVKGYNPYDSGKLARTGRPPKKTDLRKLGNWIKLKKQVEKNDPEEDK